MAVPHVRVRWWIHGSPLYFCIWASFTRVDVGDRFDVNEPLPANTNPYVYDCFIHGRSSRVFSHQANVSIMGTKLWDSLPETDQQDLEKVMVRFDRDEPKSIGRQPLRKSPENFRFSFDAFEFPTLKDKQESEMLRSDFLIPIC